MPSKPKKLIPLEQMTIDQLAQIIKSGADWSNISEKEFQNMILSRRPLELILMAHAFTY